MPELRDLSLRQAFVTIQALGLQVKGITYEPSAYKDIILDIQSEDKTPILAGSSLAEGTPIILVVGKGQGTSEVTVPSVVGKSLTDARSWLLGSKLSVGVVEYDIPPTEETQEQYIVYSQSPESGTVVVEGTNVNLKLSTDIEKTITADNEVDEEEFF
jgi:beta-lactam-binding protein with PASTA domain